MIIKRTGQREPLDIDKIHKVVSYACEGITGVSASEVEINSKLKFYDGITTNKIQETLIKSAAELITEEHPNYQYVAGRLVNYHLRKQVYGTFTPPPLIDIVRKNIELGLYDPAILDYYNQDEWNELNNIIVHQRDETFTHCAMEQMRGKYLIKNRTTGQIYETPQVAYLLIAATIFSGYPPAIRFRYIKDYYNAISKFKLSLPTPIMAGVRTPTRQYSSCVLIDSDDSLASINASSSAIVNYVSQRAGIGINGGRIRAIHSPIRHGEASHTGVIPFYKHWLTAVKSCSQGGVRGGAATLFYPAWHLEFEDLIVLKNNQGIEDNRIRGLDYGVQFNGLLYQRLIDDKDITLFSPHDVPGLYEAFFTNQERFRELYQAAEQDDSIRKKTVPALQLFSTFMQERTDTGRIYLQNVDHCNTHGSFIEQQAPIYQSNLCMEITLPTVPLDDIQDEQGRIPLCTLSAINWGSIKSPQEFMPLAKLAVRALDALLDYQNYPVKAARLATHYYRPLGIGIINFAAWMAKHNIKYSDPDLSLIDEYMEAFSYALIKASADLAVEIGPCPGQSQLKYSQGILPIDTYKSTVDTLCPPKYRQDWKSLRQQLQDTGIRNATLMAIMPSETSSMIQNATNGIEPPRALISTKINKDCIVKQVVPQIQRLKNKYELLWDQPSPEGYLKICAIMQKYIDQSISVNTSYNPRHYPQHKLSQTELLKHLLLCYSYGLKTLYYFNQLDGCGDELEDDCESCKI